MLLDFTAQTVPVLWALIAALVLMGLIVFACIDPELAEVYLGDWQLVVAAVGLAAILIVVGSGHADAAHQLWLLPGR
jgi:hypothetical protein